MTIYTFGEFRLDTERMEVAGADGVRETEPQVFDVLRYLVEQHDRLVTKEELLDNVWGDRFVSESALTTRIKQARRLIDDDGRSQSRIRTIRGRGFRFLTPVAERAAAEPVATTATELPRELAGERTKPFVGRAPEVRRALAVVERPNRTVAWIQIVGEPGIGKTRLAARIAQLADERGTAVLFGRCSEDLAVPYQPIIEAIRSATAAPRGDALLAAMGPSAFDLTRLVPELADELPDDPRPGPADPETERHRLYEAIGGWFEAVAAGRSVVVVIDDAHWATDSTMRLLVYLARSSLDGQLTFVLTARDTAPDARPELRELISAIDADPESVTLRMGGLAEDEIRELVDPDVDVAAVARQTAGNPLLIGAVVGNSDHPAGADIDTAVHRRLARLEQSVREALTVAAIVGLEFDLKVVAAALRRDELQLIDELDLAVEARLLEESGGDLYSFAHALVRASLRDAMSSPRRARWHGRTAEAFELVHAHDVDRFATAIAHHYAAASASNPTLRFVAIDHLRDAARRAADQLSYVEAIELLDWAASLAEPDDLEPLTAIALERGQAEANGGAVQAALDSFDHALDLARRSGRADLVAEAALRFEDASWRPGRFGGPSIERLTEALDLIAHDDVGRRARLLVALTRAWSMAGDPQASDEAFAAARPLIAQLGEPELEARSLGARYSVYLDVGPTPPLEPITRLRALCDHIDDIEAELLARQIHLRYMVRLGRMDDYRRGLDEMTTLTDDLRSSFWRYIVTNHHAMLALYDGDLQAAEQTSVECAEAAARLVDDDTTGTLGLRMFLIRREQDRVRQLAPAIRRLVESGETTSFWTPGLALLMLETGQREQAASLLHEFRDHDFELPIDAMWSTVMVMLIELASRLDDTESCRILAKRFAGQEGSAIVTGHGIVCFGSGDRYLGMLAAALGDDDRAEEHLVAAIEFDGRNGGVLWATHARWHLAELYRRLGRVDESDLLRDEVRAVAKRRGYRLLERLAG